ncbi:hypothetical protein JNUCC1_03333 [Lentibacillus sp. JNUCC-1]|uniref:dUTP diphosphatase n=1 Tax=Lentibacillus sp. JNUCC-1 TaxID=2654513 RepID=UPI0012E72299|nr:dUTP diphosphatase [Lentibacillus sp. JNUCC-1]MUV39455.1 hypothetical protein [Lentibacillus sp. JNUCC-1]
MDLSKLAPIQKELDDRILKEHGLKGQELIKKKTVALLTELYECVNDARFFKYWSSNQAKKATTLEEYVDTMHFAISIANDVGYAEHEYIDPGHMDVNDLVIGLTNVITLLPENKIHRHVGLMFNFLIKLGELLGYDQAEIEAAYLEKNKENHTRQDDGY